MIDNIKVGKTISTLRQERGMTQQQLAAALNVSHQAVSKWENGAALPDISTLLELTRLFGITVEQLMNGEIPEAEPEVKTTGMKIDEHIQNFGNFVSNMVDGIFKPAPDASYEEAGEAEEPLHVPEDEFEETESFYEDKHFDVQKILKMAPFMSKSALDEIMTENCDRLTVEDITKLAPFLSRSTLDVVLSGIREKLTPDDISKLAPFLSRSTLEKLIRNSEDEINWDVLQKVAPFLKRDMVDAFTKAAAKGERVLNRVFSRNECEMTDFEKSFEDFSKKISNGVEKVARHAQKFGEELVEGLSAAFCESEEEKPVRSRAKELRIAAVERAMADGRWDWIAQHLSDTQDEEMRGRIAQAAMDQGMNDWLKTNLPEYALINDAETALENGDWEKIAACAAGMDAGYQARAALKAAGEDKWAWLIENKDKLAFGENAAKIAVLAYESDMKDTALTIAEARMDEAEVELFMETLINKGDCAFAGEMSHLVGSAFLERICMKLLDSGKCSDAEGFLAMIETDGIERLMEKAISLGDFAAVDLLDDYLVDEEV